MPAHSSLKASDSHNTLKSSIVPGGLSALSLKLDATRDSFHRNTQLEHPHSWATAATLHHSQTINPESDSWRFLGSMPAIQRYKIHPQRDIIHEVTGLNGVGCCRSQNSMAVSSTTAAPILNLIAGDYWAGRQLRNGIRYVPVTSKPMKSLSSVQGVSDIKPVFSKVRGPRRARRGDCQEPWTRLDGKMRSTPVLETSGRPSLWRTADPAR